MTTIPRRHPHGCSAPDCRKRATVQWSRRATPDEAAAHVRRMTATQQRLVDHQRTNATLHVLELEQRLERLETAAPTDARAAAVLPTARQQLKDAQTTLDAITDPTPVEIDDVVIAVQACDDHAVTGDAATRLHNADCLTGGKCRCTPAKAKRS